MTDQNIIRINQNPTKEELDVLKEYLEYSGKKYVQHNCSLCNYPCGYVILNSKIYYDAGINCPQNKKGYCKLEERTEEELYLYLKKYYTKIYSKIRQFFS